MVRTKRISLIDTNCYPQILRPINSTCDTNTITKTGTSARLLKGAYDASLPLNLINQLVSGDIRTMQGELEAILTRIYHHQQFNTNLMQEALNQVTVLETPSSAALTYPASPIPTMRTQRSRFWEIAGLTRHYNHCLRINTWRNTFFERSKGLILPTSQ